MATICPADSYRFLPEELYENARQRYGDVIPPRMHPYEPRFRIRESDNLRYVDYVSESGVAYVVLNNAGRVINWVYDPVGVPSLIPLSIAFPPNLTERISARDITGVMETLTVNLLGEQASVVLDFGQVIRNDGNRNQEELIREKFTELHEAFSARILPAFRHDRTYIENGVITYEDYDPDLAEQFFAAHPETNRNN